MNDDAAKNARLEQAALNRIAALKDPEKLRNIIVNAKAKGATEVEDAAFARLCAVQPNAEPGSLEFDVWQSIFALEEMLREERGKTTRLSRTRQKITKDGEAKTCAELTLRSAPSEGFDMLVSRGRPELLFEAVVLRHSDRFEANIVEAAQNRMAAVRTATKAT